MLDLIYPTDSRSLVLENTPINVEMFYNYRGNERFVHLVNYSGDKREVGTPMAQDIATVYGIIVRVILPGRPIKVTLVPDGMNVSFDYSNGWLKFEALPLNIHHVYKIELS